MSQSRLEFDIEGTDVSVLNAIRRVGLSEIPNVAVNFDPVNSDIRFIKNTSVLHNEYTGHRISLLPLCFDEAEIENFDPTLYKFVIEVKGEKRVTTGDIKIYDEHGSLYDRAFHDKIFPADPVTKGYIIVTKLKSAEEELHVEFTATKGIAKTHARWSPVSTCTYFNNLDEKKVAEARALVDTTTNPSAMNKFETLDKFRLFKKNEYDEAISFHVIIESECRMRPSYIFDTAVKVIQDKLRGLDDKFRVTIIEESIHMYAVEVNGEDHTIGNLLQAFIFNEYVRKEDRVDFVGYVHPHPLEDRIFFKIRFLDSATEGQSTEGCLEFFKEATSRAVEMMKGVTIPTTKAKKAPKKSTNKSTIK